MMDLEKVVKRRFPSGVRILQARPYIEENYAKQSTTW